METKQGTDYWLGSWELGTLLLFVTDVNTGTFKTCFLVLKE